MWHVEGFSGWMCRRIMDRQPVTAFPLSWGVSMSTESSTVTALLERIRQGSAEAKDELVALLYDRFRQRAHQRLRHERPGHSLATTDLAHEAWLRLRQNEEFAKA